MIILAGGEATRLGPLTAQLSKALVSIKQRPIIAHHVQRAVVENCDEIVVVTSPGSDLQVSRVLDRMSCPVRYRTVIQQVPHGPVDALQHAVRALGPMRAYDFAIVTAADTYVDASVRLPDRPFIATAETSDTGRSWCHFTDRWVDAPIDRPSKQVFIGLLGAYLHELGRACNSAIELAGRSSPMSPVIQWLYDYTSGFMHQVAGWHDTGDLGALAAARRATFTSRPKHEVTLDDRGIITKNGVMRDEVDAVTRMSRLHLGPQFISFFPDGRLKLEYCDLPSLAELYLYWPGRPDTWRHIIEVVLLRLERDLWSELLVDSVAQLRNQSYSDACSMYLTKPRIRQAELGCAPPQELEAFITAEVLSTMEITRIHGDLNFGNILYSLGTDTFRLIDPRGTFGTSKIWGDKRYEYAKLRFSYRHGLTAITHGVNVDRTAEADAIDELLLERGVNLKHIAAIEATLFLSSMPLHDESEHEPMRLAALDCMKEALG